MLRTDNGSEFCGRAMLTWAHTRGVTLRLIEPGKPTQNAYIESFNGRSTCTSTRLPARPPAVTAIGSRLRSETPGNSRSRLRWESAAFPAQWAAG